MKKPELQEKYESDVCLALQKELGQKNIMAVPRLEKIVVNVGVKDAVADSRALAPVKKALARATGQRPVQTVARKSIAGFKLREGMPIGVKVTLRGKSMYNFLGKLINLALPNVRDFQGVGTKFDGCGNYNLGIKEWNVFPELDQDFSEKVYGMNVTVHTTAESDEHARALLKGLGMPFRK